MPAALTLEWRPQACADLLVIVTYIARDNPAAAQALKDEIKAKVGALPTHPKLYKPGRIKGTRVAAGPPELRRSVPGEQPGRSDSARSARGAPVTEADAFAGNTE